MIIVPICEAVEVQGYPHGDRELGDVTVRNFVGGKLNIMHRSDVDPYGVVYGGVADKNKKCSTGIFLSYRNAHISHYLLGVVLRHRTDTSNVATWGWSSYMLTTSEPIGAGEGERILRLLRPATAEGIVGDSLD